MAKFSKAIVLDKGNTTSRNAAVAQSQTQEHHAVWLEREAEQGHIEGTSAEPRMAAAE